MPTYYTVSDAPFGNGKLPDNWDLGSTVMGCTCNQAYWSVVPMYCPVHNPPHPWSYQQPVTIATNTTGQTPDWRRDLSNLPPPDYVPGGGV